MTTLSYALWAIDLLSGLEDFAFITGIVFFLASIISTIIYFVCKAASNSGEKEATAFLPSGKALMTTSWVVLLVSSLITVAIPDNVTMNRIIAIEATNYVAQTEEAQKIKDKILDKVNKLLEE